LLAKQISAIESALQRATGLWNLYPDEFRRLIVNGMRRDFSWSGPGAKYLEIYDYIRHK
jgi:starch synthase